MHPTRSLLVSSLTLCALLLAGCGGGNDAVKAAAKAPNSFKPKDKGDSQQQSEGSTTEINACQAAGKTVAFSYCVTVEGTEAMLASWDRTLFDWLTPHKAYALRGLGAIEANSIEVVQLNSQGAILNPDVVPDYNVVNNKDGTYSVNFVAEPPARADIFVKATLANGQTLMAPFQTSGQNVINVASQYLVNQLFSTATTAQFENLLPCAKETGCPQQPESKLEILWGLTSVVQNYELDIPATATIPEALTFLGNTVDFKQHVARALDTILSATSPFVGATTREIPKADDPLYADFVKNFARYERYNANYFGFNFNRAFSADAVESTVLATQIATQVGTPVTQGGLAFTYPNLQILVLTSNRTATAISGDVPFLRTELQDLPGGNKVLASFTEPNSFATGNSNTFLGITGNYLTGKVPLQTITDKTGSTGTGWQYNPVVSNVFRKQESSSTQDALHNAHFGTGNRYQLSRQTQNSWLRTYRSEAQNMFSFFSFLPAAPDATPFSLTSLNGKNYGVVSFALQLSDTGTLLNATGKLSQWSITGSTATETQPNANLVTYRMGRQSDNSVTALSSAASGTNDMNILLEENLETGNSGSDATTIAQVPYQRGRLRIAGNFGAAAPDGSQIALTLRNAGHGLSHAIQLRTAKPDFLAGTIFDLQGHSLGLTTTTNSAMSYSGSTLRIINSASAELVLRSIQTQHDVTTHQLSAPTENTTQTLSGSYSSENTGFISFTFPAQSPSQTELKLQGFITAPQSTGAITEPGNQMVLLLQQGNRLGLVYAGKRQNLPTD